MIIVLFDGACSMCIKEINYYKKIAPVGRFKWVDIGTEPKQCDPFNIPLTVALLYLHVFDDNNKLHVGLDGFRVIWQALPRWQLLAKVAGLPGLHFILSHSYKVFARWRFKRKGYCQLKQIDD